MNDIHGDVAVIEKKKRGRKPKNESLTLVVGDGVSKIKSTSAAKKKQTANDKKNKDVFAYDGVVQEFSISGPLTEATENIILKLRVLEPKETSTHINDNGPCAYNEDQMADFSSINTFNTHKSERSTANPDVCSENNQIPIHDHSTVKKTGTLRVVDLLRDFEEKSKNNEWPMSTSISCHWCCHKFNSQPFGMPVKYDASHHKFCVIGCFCSLECAAAHNLASRDTPEEVFERMHLLNMLSRRMDMGILIKPAPTRLSLKMFGGHMEIEEFRAFTSSHKVLHFNFPPMQQLTQQLEEVNECDVIPDLRYIPFDHERVNRYKEKIKMFRDKPSSSTQSTLDDVMQFSVTG